MTAASSPVRFRSGDDSCAADLALPPGYAAGRRHPAIVIGHGFNVTKEALPGHAAYLAQAGYVVLAIDYRRFGASGGAPRQLLRPPDEVEDFRNAITFLQQRDDIDAERIGIWGVSFGGGIVLQTAAIDRRVRCVVAQSPAYLIGRDDTKELFGAEAFARLLQRLQEDHIRRFRTGEGERVPCLAVVTGDVLPVMPGDALGEEFVRRSVELFPTYAYMIPLESAEHMMNWAPMQVIEQIAPTPMLIVTNGGYDIHHSLERIQEAYRRAGEPKRIEILPYDSVGLYVEPGMGDAMNRAIAWFHQHLGR
jgi:alpha-beta hydrolase superfamily lysophospholipase